MRVVAAVIGSVLACQLASCPSAADARQAGSASWPQWGGPERSFQLSGRGLHWKGPAPKQAWQRDLGDGYAAIVGDAKTVYATFRQGETMKVAALDTATGRPRWEQSIDDKLLPNMFLDYGRGPNSTPLLSDGRLFVATFTGRLCALDAATGRTLWTRELWTDLKGTFRDVGYSNSPIAFRDLLILPVGGKGKGVSAFRQRDGSTAWMSGDLENAMSSPILVDVGGEVQLVSLMVEGAAGFDPVTGTSRWFHPHKTNADVNVSTPVWHAPSQTLIVSSAYDNGARAIRLNRTNGRTTASEAWHTPRLRVHHGNMLVLQDHVYGSSGDFGPAPLTAVAIASGKVAWQDRTFPKVNMVQVGDRTIVLDEDGRLAIATLSPVGLKVLQEAPITTKLSWTPPTLIGTRLYIRDRKTLVALDLELE